jgi:alpha-1,3-mannosyltransferase
MRVCHLVRQYAPSVGGLENFVHMLAASLTDLGCECEVLTLNRLFCAPSEQLPDEETIDGVKVRRTALVGHQRFFLPLIPNEMLAPYDVLHVHGVDGMFDRLARQRRRDGQVLLATSHGLFFHTPWMAPVKAAYLHTITRLAAGQYDLLIANSASDEIRLRSVSANVVKLANGVSSLGSFTAHGADLLCLGRLTRHKHVERIIAALSEPALAGVRLHVVGPPGDVSLLQLARHAEWLGVADRVVLHGGVSRAELAAIAAQCALFVSASTYEGFGMALIEAMSVGLVPAVQANPSFVELVSDADIGCVTDFSQPRMAARAVRQQLDALSATGRTKAIAFSGNFSWRGHAARTLGLYKDAHRGAVC